MAVEIRRVPLPASAPHVPLGERLYGLGSVFGKSIRDSRRGMLVMGSLLGFMVIAGGLSMATTYDTAQARLELAAMSATLPPAMRGIYGDPVNVDTMGGFISWHYGPYLALLGGLWSLLALSSTLAGEAQRGSLDFAVAAPHSRRSIALQKAVAHVTAVGIVMAFLAAVAWATSAAGGSMARDAIQPFAALSFAVGLGLKALVAGSVAFAVAPFLGRGAAAGIAGTLMLGGYVIHSYRTVVPAFETVSAGSWFTWMAGHVPLAGRTDWAGAALTAVVTVVLLSVGMEAFARRDIGVTIPVPTPRLPGALLGVRGPLSRSLGDLLPRCLWWSLGLGGYGLLMIVSSRSLLDALNASPAMTAAFRTLVPGTDITTTAWFLQLAFADIGFVLVGLASATLIAVRSADETSGRLELQLAAPLSRTRWAIASGVAVCLGIAVIAGLLALAVAMGVLLVGQDAATPAVGTLALAAYGMALAGIGVAVAGVSRPSFAVPAVVGVVFGTFILDFMALLLRLPDWVAQLSLTAHLGEPMVGAWDGAGLIACLLIAAGGLLVGAFGMRRRDIEG